MFYKAGESSTKLTNAQAIPQKVISEGKHNNEAVCITKSCSKMKENVPQSVLIANLGDQGNCVVSGSCGQDTLKLITLLDESCAKVANGTINGAEIRSGAKTPELGSSMKGCNDGGKNHSWKAPEKKVANSNIDDGRKAPSDMKTLNSKGKPCIDFHAAFVQHMMQLDEETDTDSEKTEDMFIGKEGNNHLSCEVNSKKRIEGNDLNAYMENPTKGSSFCIATNNGAVVRHNLMQRPRASGALYTYSRAKECNGINLCRNVTCQKGKGVIQRPEVVNDLNAAPMQISDGAPKTYQHLPSSSGGAALGIVYGNSSYTAMDIDLNVPLDVTPPDLENSHAEASSMGPSDPHQATHNVPQTTQPQTANQPAASIMLFGRVIYEALSTGTANRTPNLQGNQAVVVPSRNMPSTTTNIWRGGQAYASWATTTSLWRGNSVSNNQQGRQQQAVLSNYRMPPYGGSTAANGAAAAAVAAAALLQPGSSAALVNLLNQHRQQGLVNTTSPYSIMRGGVPVPSHLIAGSSSNNGSNSVQQQQWPIIPILDTSRLVFGYPFYYPAATANQAPPATATAMPTTGTNNGEGASTSSNR